MATRNGKKYEEIYEILRTRILSGGLRPGDKLPNERELAVQLGVATMTLRRALDRLEEEGHLMRRPYHGTVVASCQDEGGEPAGFRVGLVVPTDLRTVAHPVFSRFLNGIEGIVSELVSGISMDLAERV